MTESSAEPAESDLLPGDYWHVTADHFTNFLLNNVFARQGRLSSMSMVRRVHGERFITLGDLNPMTGPKEDIWEEVRISRFSDRPSRLGALFLFDRKQVAEQAATEWRPDMKQVALRARIPKNARLHRGDIAWFEATQLDEEVAAARYWAGDPCPRCPGAWEYVIDGEVYFPDWRKPPFGPFGGNGRPTASATEGGRGASVSRAVRLFAKLFLAAAGVAYLIRLVS